MSIYDFTLTRYDGEEIPLSKFKGKTMLIVNTATRCGFTKQLKDLEYLYKKYKDDGFEIISVPCNQFMNQTPEDDNEIEKFCRLSYNTSFIHTKKSDVNGENELPLYTYLKSKKGFKTFGKGLKAAGMCLLLRRTDKDCKKNPDIKWNFTKFLIDKNGNVVRRFEATENVLSQVEPEIQKIL